MKLQIRSNVFETNSSSTHSLAIPKDCDIISKVSFAGGDFGWEFAEADPANYLYVAIYEVSNTLEEVKSYLTKLKKILDKHNITYNFEPLSPEFSKYLECDEFYLSDASIDHGYELKSFVKELFEDEDKLLRFISHGLVFTGNDNEGPNGYVDRTKEFFTTYNWDTREEITKENPYYMTNWDDYEWRYKDN